MSTEKNLFHPTRQEPEARRQKRRDSQARHRHNIAMCYKNLRAVLPEEDITKVCGQFRKKPDLLQDAFSGIKCNKTTTLMRAKDYVLHLESVVATLLAEKHTQSHLSMGLVGNGAVQTSLAGKQEFSEITDIRRNFVRNFTLEKSLFEYDFECVPEPEEISTINSNKESSDEDCKIDVDLNQVCDFTTEMLCPTTIPTNAFFIPVNIPPPCKQNPMVIEVASSDRSLSSVGPCWSDLSNVVDVDLSFASNDSMSEEGLNSTGTTTLPSTQEDLHSSLNIS